MSGAIRFGSSCDCHHSGIFLGYLTAILLVVGTCTQSWAEENSVSITINGPALEEGSENLYFDLRELILESFDDALSQDFEVLEDSDQANYGIDLTIRGPYNECYWKIKCKWYKKDSDKKTKCWSPAVMVPYCKNSSIEVFSQINCLGEIVNFGALAPPIPEKDLCKTNKDQDLVKYKVVYTTCFKVQLEDDVWKEKIRTTAEKIPMQIEFELDDEFKEFGYDILPERCFEATARPQKVDFEIVGWIHELPEKNAIYVELIVDDKKERQRSTAFRKIKQISGITQEIRREDHTKLVESIISHIRKQFESDE